MYSDENDTKLDWELDKQTLILTEFDVIRDSSGAFEIAVGRRSTRNAVQRLSCRTK